MATDFEAEGLLDGVEGDAARQARLELLRHLEEQGFELEQLRSAAAEGRLPLLPVEFALEGSVPHYTAAEAAARSGLELEQFEALNRAIGLARPDPDERAFTERDVEGARSIRLALEAGLPQDDLFEVTRVMSRGAATVAEAAFGTVGRVFLQPGDTEHDLGLRYAEATRALTPLLAESLERLLLIHLRELVRQAAVDSQNLASGSFPDAPEIAVCFADIVGFTPLGERLEPEELGEVAERLGRLAGEVAQPPVRLVKTIGDAVMLVSRDSGALLNAALELVEAAAGDADGESFPELRAGLALGPGLSRGGDWYGRPVNLASRITGVARPSSVLVAEDMRDAVGDGYRWSFAGRRRLKGVKGDVGLFRARRAEPEDEAGS